SVIRLIVCCSQRLATALYVLNPLPATSEIYSLSLHDALPILIEFADELGMSEASIQKSKEVLDAHTSSLKKAVNAGVKIAMGTEDRKSTRLNSSHVSISYAVFCLKKKKNVTNQHSHDKQYG